MRGLHNIENSFRNRCVKAVRLGMCPLMPRPPHLFQTLTNEFMLYLLKQQQKHE